MTLLAIYRQDIQLPQPVESSSNAGGISEEPPSGSSPDELDDEEAIERDDELDDDPQLPLSIPKIYNTSLAIHPTRATESKWRINCRSAKLQFSHDPYSQPFRAVVTLNMSTIIPC